MKNWGARSGPLPSLNYLIALEASARLGSFRAAAEEMNLTQGAVAQQIRALESELGCQLFERQARGLGITQAGLDYVNRIRLALGVIEEATRELQGANNVVEANQLTLSTTPSFASRWLIPRLPRLAELHPEIALMIDASNALRPLHGPGHVDLAIRWAKPPFTDAQATLLLHGPLVPVCSPRLLARYPVSHPAELAGLPLLSDSYTSWQRWFEVFANGEQPRMSGPSFTQTSLALDAAEQGMGVALVPRPLAESALSNGTLVLAVGEAYQLDTGAGFHVLTGSPVAEGSALAKVIEWLSAEAQAITAGTH